jgi:hypothetical protein
MKTVLITVFFSLLTMLVNVSGSARPNVVLILTDDQGYSDVGFNGNPIVHTSVLDAFAADAVVFDRFYANPVCSPTRAALMTGRYAYRTGVLETETQVAIEGMGAILKQAYEANALFSEIGVSWAYKSEVFETKGYTHFPVRFQLEADEPLEAVSV